MNIGNETVSKMEIEERSMSTPFLPQLSLTSLSDSQEGLDQNESPLHFQKAAALVYQAMSGHWMPFSIVEQKDYESAKKAFLIYHQIDWVRTVVCIILVLVPYFQEPFWFKEKISFLDEERNYPLSGIAYIPASVSLIIQILCFFLLVWSVFLQRRFQGMSFWKNSVSFYKMLLLTGMALGMSQTALEIFGFISFKIPNISGYIYNFIPLIFNSTLRISFFMTLQIIYNFLDIAVLLLIFLLLSAWLATSLFFHHVQYKSYRVSLLNLFILLTTSNSPDVWAPVYSENHFTIIFFFFYVIFGVFFLMNFLFSVIYTNYKIQMATQVKLRVTARQESLRQAFNLLDVHMQGWIDARTILELFLAIFQYRNIPDDRARRTQLFFALDKRGDFKISVEEFEEVCNVISDEIEQDEGTGLLFEKGPKFLHRLIPGLSHLHYIHHPVYHFLRWIAIFCGACFAIYDIYMRYESLSWSMIVALEYALGWLFILDDSLRIMAMGWKNYWEKYLNCYNLFITSMTIILTIVACTIFPTSVGWIYLLLILRMLSVLAMVKLFSRWLLMARTLLELMPATVPILSVQYSTCSFFSLLGVQFFGGAIFSDNPTLQGTSFAELGLWHFNFNDYASAMVTNFSLCIVNNWYVFMDAFVAATGSEWARVYFISFWAVSVAFVLNVVVALFVEAFIRQVKNATAEKIEGKAIEAARSCVHGNGNAEKRFYKVKKTLSCYDIYENMVGR